MHDYVDPSVSTWFYADVNTSLDKVIFNKANGQTSDLTIDVSSGSVYYTYNGGNVSNNEKQPATVFTGDDKPASKPGRVWVLSKLDTFNVYSWESANDSNKNGEWPGVTATKSAFVLEN